MHVKTLPDSLAATSRDAGCGFSIAWMELTVIFCKIAWQWALLWIHLSAFATAEVGVLPESIGLETPHFAENSFSPPDSRRSTKWKPPDGLTGNRQRFGALAELLRSSTVALGAISPAMVTDTWRRREALSASSLSTGDCLRARAVLLSSTTGPALSVSRITCLVSGRVPRPGQVTKLSIFPLKIVQL